MHLDIGRVSECEQEAKTTSKTMCIRNKLIRFLLPDTILVAFIENSFETIFFTQYFFLDKFKLLQPVAHESGERIMYTIKRVSAEK